MCSRGIHCWTAEAPLAEESWVSELPSCCQRTSGFSQPGQEMEASFLAAYEVIGEPISSRTLKFGESAASVGHFFFSANKMM